MIRYLSNHEVMVLNCIRQFNREKHDPTKREIAARLGKHETTIYFHLRTLFDLDFIVRYGKYKEPDRYFVKTRMLSMLDFELQHTELTETSKAP